MTDFTKPAIPPYLRYDHVKNRTNDTWIIEGYKGEVLTVNPGDWVLTIPIVVPASIAGGDDLD